MFSLGNVHNRLALRARHDEAGWPSTQPLGLTKDIAGKWAQRERREACAGDRQRE